MKKKIILSLILLITPDITYTNDASIHHYLWANYRHFSGNRENAQQWYTKLFSTNCSIYTYKGYVRLLAETNQHKRIIELMPLIEKNFEKDAEVQLLFILALEKNKQQDLADKKILTIHDSFKKNAEITFKSMHAYLRRKEPENALLVIDTFLNNSPHKPHNFIFYFYKAQIYIQLGRYNEALENNNKCLEIHPHFDQGWLLLASLKEQQGMIKDALSHYGTFLEIAGNNPTIEKHMQALISKYNKAVRPEHPTALSLSKGGLYERTHFTPLENAQLLFKQKNFPQALTHINTYLEQNNNTIQSSAQLLKIEILAAMNSFDAIADFLIQLVEENPHNQQWPKTAHLLAHHTVPPSVIIDLFQKLEKKYPHALWPHLYCADLCIRNNNNTSALSALEAAVPLTADTLLRSKILHQISLLHYENQQYNKMYASLEQAYLLNPDSPHINNSLAYYWAIEGNDLSKAEQLIDKALKHDNTNPYFLDTHAYILYKQKKYEQAYHILKPVAQHAPHAIIHSHLTDIESALQHHEK